ncbi:MAG: TetR/AcrR family transcriptional regulator [Armatimonadota bacterium]
MAESANRKKERRKQILEAAMRIFAQKGFERATTKAIAAEAGVAEGTIFIYFPTKRDLLISCMQQKIVEPLPEIFNNESISDEEVVREFFKNRFRLLRANQGMFKLMISEGLYNPDLLKEFFERIFSPGLAEVARYFSRKMESGAFKKLDPAVVARTLVGQVIFHAWILVISNTDPDEILSEDLVNTLTVIFLDGVRA